MRLPCCLVAPFGPLPRGATGSVRSERGRCLSPGRMIRAGLPAVGMITGFR